MQNRHSPTIEDYLSILFVLQRDNEPIVGARLAELLGVTPPTVTNTLKRMARDGLVVMDDPRNTRLSEAGWEAACSVMRRHMLIEWLLSRMVGWSKSHSQAHAMEHVISAELEEALINDLSNPKTCPHGNPLPGFEQVVAAWVPLTSLSVGEKGIIRRIHELAEQTEGVLPYLEEKRLLPGCPIEMIEVLPFNQTVTLRVEGQPVTLGFALARYIFVEQLP
ncbi:MAG: metal-dependent transcriptional regulator [Anaerolineales bacterium]|nr:metal-dependent transcriptional regulator [Anaerolineales bacterium]